jgi:uncharacterized protein (TIGR04255 family)
MGQKMSNAPVYFTVAQVRFNPILNLDEFLPNIQDKMRTSGFPDFKQEIIQRIGIPFGANEPGQSAALAARYNVFGDMVGTTGFVLDNNALTLQTTAYETFESFSKLLLTGLGIVHKAIELNFIERVGLRYLDAVLPKENESVSDYLTPEVMGLSQKLTGQTLRAVSETVTTNRVGKLISRVIIQNGHVGLPPEMAALAPRIDPRFTALEGWYAIIDTDAFREQREAFNLEKLETTLVTLHEEIEKSFNATVTPHALATWA